MKQKITVHAEVKLNSEKFSGVGIVEFDENDNNDSIEKRMRACGKLLELGVKRAMTKISKKYVYQGNVERS